MNTLNLPGIPEISYRVQERPRTLVDFICVCMYIYIYIYIQYITRGGTETE